MYKLPITYTNFEDKEVTKDFYFNLTKAELMKLNFKTRAGKNISYEELSEAAHNAVKNHTEITANEQIAIVDFFEEFIKAAYGVKTQDGEFDKSEELSNRFIHSEAYSVMLMDMLDNEAKASEFMIGVAPNDMRGQLQNYLNDNLSK